MIDPLCRITAAKTAIDLTEDLHVRISELVAEHGLLDAPPWMLNFVSMMANGVPARLEIILPRGYPDGSNGLVNILADIETNVGSLGIDDQGECWTIDIPSSGVSICVSREHNGGDLAVLTPHNPGAGGG